MNSKTILQMFSGGRDSLLAACRLLSKGHSVWLVTYDNGCVKCVSNAKFTAEFLVEKYGKDRVNFLTHCTIGVWREFFLPFLNLKPSDIINRYGEITYSQFNCLTCKASMYVYSVAICKAFGLHTISDGARHSQGFAVDLDPVLSRFESVVKSQGLELVLPVLSLDSDWKRKNELLRKSLPTKVLEPQCLMGVPLGDSGLQKSVVTAVCNFFDQEIAPKFSELVKEVQQEIN